MNIDLCIEYFEEDGAIVALCPELQVSSFGDTMEEAESSVKEALDLFFEGCDSLGTLEEVLEESSFHKIGDKWTMRKPINSARISRKKYFEQLDRIG